MKHTIRVSEAFKIVDSGPKTSLTNVEASGQKALKEGVNYAVEDDRVK